MAETLTQPSTSSYANEAPTPFNSHELPILAPIDPTENILQAQLLGEEEVNLIKSTPRFDTTGRRISSPYYNLNQPIDYSQEAIKQNAFALAAETLPQNIVKGIGIREDIPDNTAYQHPPSLNTIILAAEAWSRTDFDPHLKGAVEAMIYYYSQDVLSDGATKHDTFTQHIVNDIREAMENSEITEEAFTTHFTMVASRETPEEREADEQGDLKRDRVAAYILSKTVDYTNFNKHSMAGDPNHVTQEVLLAPDASMVSDYGNASTDKTLRLDGLTDEDGTVKVDMSEFLRD